MDIYIDFSPELLALLKGNCYNSMVHENANILHHDFYKNFDSYYMMRPSKVAVAENWEIENGRPVFAY